VKRLLFISHKESDQEIAALLVDFLLSALDLNDEEVRCTSVPGHQLPFGISIAQQLQNDLNASVVLIALITTYSLRSTWVLFELGASWAMGKLMVPILGPGLTYQHLPGPLTNYPSVQITADNASARLRDAVKQLASNFEISEKTGGKTDAKLKKFITTFETWRVAPQPTPVQSSAKEESKVRELDKLIHALENFHSNPEGIYYIGQTLLECESFLERINLSTQADELITPLVEEIDNDTRKEEGLFDPIISIGKVRKLVKFLKQTRLSFLGENTGA
jgi:hypothetical protein